MGGVSCPINNRRAVDCHLRGLLADKNLVLLDLFVSEEMMIVTAAQQRRFVSIFWCDAAQSEIIQCDNVGLGAALAPHQEETRTSRGRRRMCQSAARVALHYLSAFVLAPCGGGLQVADCGCLATVSRDMKLVHTQVVASLVATDAPFTLLFFSFFFFLHASLLAHQVDRSTAEDTRQTRHLANKAKSVALAAWPLGFATTKLLTSALSLWRDIPLDNSQNILTHHNTLGAFLAAIHLLPTALEPRNFPETKMSLLYLPEPLIVPTFQLRHSSAIDHHWNQWSVDVGWPVISAAECERQRW